MLQAQQALDAALDRVHTLRVVISRAGPLPATNPAYDAARALTGTGFSLTPRDLLHAIGCKTAALPMSARDECVKAAWLYTAVLDLQGPHLRFRGDYGADLQTTRSHEIGIGLMCLIAQRCFGIDWDQLEALPGQGRRFDYRGRTEHLRCIFEAKGTSSRAYQTSQIESGLDKKAEYHRLGEYFDVELIVSSCIEHNGGPPRIILADPDKSSFKKLYEKGDARYYRLKHYCRVLQYIGLPRSAYYLNRYAREYLHDRMSVYRPMFSQEQEEARLTSLMIDGDAFVGQWFESWLPRDSRRYKRLYGRIAESELSAALRSRSVFQGVRSDIYKTGLPPSPFKGPLLEEKDLLRYQEFDQKRVSVFPDGTVMIFRQE